MIRVCLPYGSDYGWGICGKKLIEELKKLTEIGQVTDTTLPLLMAVQGANFQPMGYVPAGPRQSGIAFIEKPSEAAKYIDTYNTYYTDLICGSTWMMERMLEIGVKKACVVRQGLDYDLFCLDRSTKPKDRPLTIFIGGKAEYRKGTDIAIAAVKVFMERHSEVRVIMAVANQWPITMHTLAQSKWIKYLPVTDDWQGQMIATLGANGVPLDRVAFPKLSDNATMPELYRSADVGLFPNRCEAGNNMVMCEAIACGMVPIATMATGHIDVLEDFEMLGAKYIKGVASGPDRWVEALDLEEILSHLEIAYDDRNGTWQDGRAMARAIRKVITPWDACAKRILEVMEARNEG